MLLVLTSIDQLPGAPESHGNYLLEVAHPAMALLEAGFDVAFVTPTGRPPLVRGNEGLWSVA